MPSRGPLPLPRHRSGAWSGGLVVESPVYTASIAAGAGTVVAATECIYRLRSGATQFQMRDNPKGFGDVVAVAVEPRASGRPARFAAATMGAVHLFDGEGVASVRFPEDHGEVHDVLWVPRVVEGGSVVDCLHVFFDDFRLVLVPDGSPLGALVRSPWPSERIDAIATDGAGGLAYARYDGDCDELEVFVPIDLAADEWGSLHCPVDSFFGAKLAIAGDAVAVSFERGGVWLTRNIKEREFVELEELRGLDPVKGGDGGGAIAFEGAGSDAALFAVIRETHQRSAIVRVDAPGRHERIAEVEMTVEGEDGDADALGSLPMIRAMAWDATRRTLWSAAGRAGVMYSTAPGAPVTFGMEGARRAAS
jgi:hypothetical protein